MSAKHTKRTGIPSREAVRRRLRALKDDEIDFSDLPEFGEDFFRTAKMLMPQPTTPITMRVDRKVLEHFKRQGQGYQSRMNAVLRAYVEIEERRDQDR